MSAVGQASSSTWNTSAINDAKDFGAIPCATCGPEPANETDIPIKLPQKPWSMTRIHNQGEQIQSKLQEQLRNMTKMIEEKLGMPLQSALDEQLSQQMDKIKQMAANGGSDDDGMATDSSSADQPSSMSKGMPFEPIISASNPFRDARSTHRPSARATSNGANSAQANKAGTSVPPNVANDPEQWTKMVQDQTGAVYSELRNKARAQIPSKMGELMTPVNDAQVKWTASTIDAVHQLGGGQEMMSMLNGIMQPIMNVSNHDMTWSSAIMTYGRTHQAVLERQQFSCHSIATRVDGDKSESIQLPKQSAKSSSTLVRDTIKGIVPTKDSTAAANSTSISTTSSSVSCDPLTPWTVVTSLPDPEDPHHWVITLQRLVSRDVDDSNMSVSVQRVVIHRRGRDDTSDGTFQWQADVAPIANTLTTWMVPKVVRSSFLESSTTIQTPASTPSWSIDRNGYACRIAPGLLTIKLWNQTNYGGTWTDVVCPTTQDLQTLFPSQAIISIHSISVGQTYIVFRVQCVLELVMQPVMVLYHRMNGTMTCWVADVTGFDSGNTAHQTVTIQWRSMTDTAYDAWKSLGGIATGTWRMWRDAYTIVECNNTAASACVSTYISCVPQPIGSTITIRDIDLGTWSCRFCQLIKIDGHVVRYDVDEKSDAIATRVYVGATSASMKQCQLLCVPLTDVTYTVMARASTQTGLKHHQQNDPITWFVSRHTLCEPQQAPIACATHCSIQIKPTSQVRFSPMDRTWMTHSAVQWVHTGTTRDCGLVGCAFKDNQLMVYHV